MRSVSLRPASSRSSRRSLRTWPLGRRDGCSLPELDLTYGAGGIVSRDVVPGVNADSITPRRPWHGSTTAPRSSLAAPPTNASSSCGSRRPARTTRTGAANRYVDVDQGSEQVAFVDERGGSVVVGVGLDNAGFLIQLRLDTGAPDKNFGNDDGIVLHQVKTGTVPFTDGAIDTDRGIYVTWVGGTATKVAALPGLRARRWRVRLRGRGSRPPWITSNARLALDPARKIVIAGSRAPASATRSPGSSARPPPTPAPSTAPSARSSPAPRTRPRRSTVATDAAGRIYCWGVGPTATRSRASRRKTSTLGLSTGFGRTASPSAPRRSRTGEYRSPSASRRPASAPRAIVVGTTGANTQPWAEAINVTGAVDAGFNGSVALSWGALTAATVARPPGDLAARRRDDRRRHAGAGLRGHAAVVTRAARSIRPSAPAAASLSRRRVRGSSELDRRRRRCRRLGPRPRRSGPADGRVHLDRAAASERPARSGVRDGRAHQREPLRGGPDYLNALARGAGRHDLPDARLVGPGHLDAALDVGGPRRLVRDRGRPRGHDRRHREPRDDGDHGRSSRAIIVAGEGRLAGDKRTWMVRLDPATGAIDPTWNCGAIPSRTLAPPSTRASPRCADSRMVRSPLAGYVGSDAAVIRSACGPMARPDPASAPVGCSASRSLGTYDPSPPVASRRRAERPSLVGDDDRRSGARDRRRADR